MPPSRVKKNRQRRAKQKAPPDFEKKKKKVGKNKKTAENATPISFKSRSVVIPPQLKCSAVQGPTTHRKQNLQVLFSQVGHYNASVRRDALVGLREIFQMHPELLPKNLPKLVERVFSTMTDSAAAVRQASHTLINTLLGLVSSDVIRPFFRILIAHLNCGLTHIQEKIQIDSLKILDSYIQHYPSLLVEHAGDILLVVVGLLSRQNSIPSHSILSSKRRKGFIGIASLVSNPSSNLVNQVSRLRIFGIISRLLDCLLLESPHYYFRTSPFVGPDDLREKFLHLADTLVSILLESWVECHPTTVISAKMPLVQSLSLMESIFYVLAVLLKLMIFSQDSDASETDSDIVVLCRKFSKDISAHVMCHFPFVAASEGKLLEVQYTLNFSVCQMILMLHKLLRELETVSESTLAAVHYLGNLDTLDIKNILSSVPTALFCSNVITDLTPVICELSHSESVQRDVMINVFAFVRNFYGACHPCSQGKQLLVKCLSKIFVSELADHESSHSLCMMELLLPWANTLLDLFSNLDEASQQMSSAVVDCITIAAVHRNAAIISELEQKLLPLFSSAVSLISKLSECTQRRLVELIWHLPVLREAELTQLSKTILSSQLHIRVKMYLVQIVHHRYTREDAENILSSSAPYLSFMFTVLIGCTSQDLSSRIDPSGKDPLSSRIEITSRSSLLGSRECILLQEMVCECLMASPISTCVLSCLEDAILKMEVSCSLPVNVVSGILALGHRFGRIVDNHVSDKLTSWFAVLCLSSLLSTSSTDCQSGDKELLSQCSELTSQILSAWQAVSKAVMLLFQDMIASQDTLSSLSNTGYLEIRNKLEVSVGKLS